MFLEILTSNHEELLVQVASRWVDYEKSRVLFATTSMAFAYHFTLTLLKERRSLLFYNAVTEHCEYVLSSFFSSVPISSPVHHTGDFKGATTLAELGILLPFLRVVHALVADVRFIPSCKVRRSFTKMSIWPTIGATMLGRMTKTVSGGFRIIARVKMYLMFQVGK